MEHVFKHEQLPSGKVIIRHFGPDGSLVDEQHSYGLLDIGIKYEFTAGVKVGETYFCKQRLVSRRSYEKARAAYTDMPPTDNTIEDWGSLLLRDMRKQQRQNKAEAERRLAESAESRFPRPTSTNWLRVIAGEKSHLVIFASRDWKVIAREQAIPIGREWLRLFGFHGPTDRPGSVAKGLEVGFEVSGNREAMLNASRLLLAQVNVFVMNPPQTSQWSGSIRPRPKPRKKPPLAWPAVLPPLIEFLSNVQEPTVKIFNHHL
ncbi:MAG: hypothetical protein JWQ71_2317 [Pedosphaera sp.]|nr:hypothetical protein [Pedosphaera sp.]